MPRAFAIIPAAGRSLRMGAPKLLLPWGESTIVESVLAAWEASGVDGVAVVVAADDRELVAACRRSGAMIVATDPRPADMKASVVAALRAVEARFAPRPDDLWLVAPADLPGLTASAIDRLLAEARVAPDRALVAGHAGRRGHPALFRWPLAAEVSRLSADGGLDSLLRRHAARVIECGEAAVASDVDTERDYDNLRSRAGRGET